MPTSALGRRLPPDFWSELHGDTILSVLYEQELVRHEDSDEPTVSLPQVRTMTGLTQGDALRVLDALVRRGRVSPRDPNTWALTRDGIEFASICPGRSQGD